MSLCYLPTTNRLTFVVLKARLSRNAFPDYMPSESCFKSCFFFLFLPYLYSILNRLFSIFSVEFVRISLLEACNKPVNAFRLLTLVVPIMPQRCMENYVTSVLAAIFRLSVQTDREIRNPSSGRIDSFVFFEVDSIYLPHTNKLDTITKEIVGKKNGKWRGSLRRNHKAYNIRLPRKFSFHEMKVQILFFPKFNEHI